MCFSSRGKPIAVGSGNFLENWKDITPHLLMVISCWTLTSFIHEWRTHWLTEHFTNVTSHLLFSWHKIKQCKHFENLIGKWWASMFYPFLVSFFFFLSCDEINLTLHLKLATSCGRSHDKHRSGSFFLWLGSGWAEYSHWGMVRTTAWILIRN